MVELDPDMIIEQIAMRYLASFTKYSLGQTSRKTESDVPSGDIIADITRRVIGSSKRVKPYCYFYLVISFTLGVLS